jgi:hypothetical protein
VHFTQLQVREGGSYGGITAALENMLEVIFKIGKYSGIQIWKP